MTLKKLAKIACVVWLVVVVVLAILAYSVERNDDGTWKDGLGRPLSDTPFLMRIFTGGSSEWAGWGWCIVDMVVFWGSVGTALTFLSKESDE